MFQVPICTFCKHWNRGTQTCAAFPEQIPDSILWGENNHKSPVDGDHGIQFEQAPDREFQKTT